MAEINVLSKEISELIAAGEVIERPASVIKELLENSIDAGAEHITVEIKNGGTTYMRITDDGSGIESEQVATAFLRHATSKITSKTDLDSIMTLGFRGEALASISAVAKVEVLTKTKNDELGTNYIIEGSIEKLNERTGCPDGTTIIIRDIFYNVPVRQKFMKRDSAEANAIISIMQKIVLSHPEISFKLIKDNRIEFTSAGDGELYSAIYGVYGRDFAHDMIPVDYSENGITVKGYVVKPLYSKSNRAFQNFFINGRYVKSVTCCVSLEEAYRNLVMVGKYPACVLMLDVPPVAVDVNVHPAKAEVRFSDEKIVFNSVYFAVKNALMASGLIYEFQMKEERKSVSDYTAKPFEPEKFEQPVLVTEKPAEPVQQVQSVQNDEEKSVIRPVSASEYSVRETVPVYKKSDGTQSGEIVLESSKTEYESSDMVQSGTQKTETDIADNEPEEETFSGFSYINRNSFKRTEPVKNEAEENSVQKDEPPIRVIGELFKNYILAELEDKMIMIDKHAAHERVIFEKLRGNCKNTDSQMLVSPLEILLSEDECNALYENSVMLENMGFKLDVSSAPYVHITAVPLILESLNMDEVIPEIAENFYLNKVDPQTHQLDDALHDLACKAAIKANDKNSIEELQKLAEDVYYNENIRHCPHGRPVMFVLTKREIEKQFRRIV